MRSIVLVLGTLLLAVPAVSNAQDAEEQAIRQTIEHYFQGMATGDSSRYRIAFHPSASLYQVLADGKRLFSRTSEEFAATARGRPSPEEPQTQRRIVSIDYTRTAATAKIELDYPEVLFTDYLTLLKIEGQWKIMNKISDYHRRVRKP